MDQQKDNRQQQPIDPTTQKNEVYDRPGSNDHNDYRIKGNEGHQEKRDEKESYTDYNGNSEANNPARAGS